MFENEEGEVDETPAEQPAAEGTDDTPPAWDGAIDSLLTQPWVPEDARPHLEKHLSAHREALNKRDFYDRVFAEDDKVGALTKELETSRTELASLKEALGKATEEVSTYKAKEEEAALSQQMQRLHTAYPDIFDEKHATQDEKGEWHGPFEHFFKLLNAGYPEEQAAKMARAFLPEQPAPTAQAATATTTPATPPAKRDVAVPKAVQAAGRSSNNPSATVNSAEANEKLDDRIARMEREERARQGMR